MKIALEGVCKTYTANGRRQGGVGKVSLTIQDREFLTLMGPSGAGKSTLLHLLNGTLAPDEGRIFFDDRDITPLPAEERPVHTVFQGLHLFPHMTVQQNVAFALEHGRERPPRPEIRRRVERLLEQVGLAGYGPRPVHQLSGGEKQRVAIARALIDHPQALLLDEPFAPLDRALKEATIELILSIKRAFGITIVMTTHDWYEALKLSDRIAILNQGRLVQVGTPHELYHRPRTVDVARLTGPVNVVSGRIEQGRFLLGPGETYGIRPSFVCLDGDVPGTVESATFLGDAYHLRVRLDAGPVITVEAPTADRTRVACRFPVENLVRLESE